MQLYYITDRSALPGDDAARRRQLLDKIDEAASAGVDYIQLREKDLTAGELEVLGRDAVRVVRHANPGTRLVLNSRTDVALAIDADGVHLRGDDISPLKVAALNSFASGNAQKNVSVWLTAVSCHSVDEIRLAEAEGASFAVLAPIFGKEPTPQAQPLGLGPLALACRGQIPVFALGGVTMENARGCAEAGARGIAAIRLFQNRRVENVVRELRGL